MPEVGNAVREQRPLWAGKEGSGLWIGIACNLLVLARVAPSLIHVLQRTTPETGEDFGETLLFVLVMGIFPIPALGAFFAWCDTKFGRDKRARRKGGWSLLLCLLTPFLWIIVSLCMPLN